MPLKIGIDGGGTKTECILVDESGAIVARHTASGCSPSVVGPDGARAILRDALRAVTAGHPSARVEGVLLCMSGNRPFWKETAAELAGFGRVEAVGDYMPVLELATAGAPGLVLHAGTGSFVAARAPDGAIHYAGGLGWRFGDPGGGYDLGRRAVARALFEQQGWEPRTALAEALVSHTGLADYAANSRLFYIDPAAHAKIAAFAPRLVELAADGCDPARLIIAESIAELADLADRVLRRLFPLASKGSPVPFGVSGRLLTSPSALPAIRAHVAEYSWPVRLQPIADPPIEGVRRLLQDFPDPSR
jgi:N-acetylglucosamine kinase-like BadF-type ATPase